MRVLFATDGSQPAEVALELVGSINWPPKSVIRLVTVVEPVEAVMAGAWGPAIAQDIDAQLAKVVASADVVVEYAARALAGTSAHIERTVLRGRAASAIVADAGVFGAEVIVVGTRGHGRIGSMLLGSVSAAVADHAPCPVLVARRSRLTRVILGTDGSDFARAAEEVVGQWPIFRQAAIEVSSVAYLGMPWTSGLALSAYPPSGADYIDIGQQIIADHQRLADETVARLTRAGLSASAKVVEGDAATELIRLADEDQAELIVVGTHGRTGLGRLVLGSVARNVMLHASCSVLVVRQPVWA